MFLFLAAGLCCFWGGFLQLWQVRSCSLLWCSGFSLWWLLCCKAQTLGTWASVAIATGSVVVALGPQGTGSVVVAHWLSWSAAREIFPDQGWNLRPLHWQADSYPLHHQESPKEILIQTLKILIPTWFTRLLYTRILFVYELRKKQTQFHMPLKESLLKAFVYKNKIFKN